jgi:hypothetical protein
MFVSIGAPVTPEGGSFWSLRGHKGGEVSDDEDAARQREEERSKFSVRAAKKLPQGLKVERIQ